ncbi:hypothetical protein HDV00_004095 [Rhizophlyctis rosea]|nr:hypothetical protein HDV00_004095 [Rhizophlyctis rosea]
MTIPLELANTIVLSGGGVLGLASLGALDYLCRNGLQLSSSHVDTLVGTGAGAMVATLLCIGYAPAEIKDIMLVTDLSRLFHVNQERLTLQNLENLIECKGVDTGERLMGFLYDLFMDKGVDPRITFRELHSTLKKRLHVVATDVDEIHPVYFSEVSHPDLRVLDAVRLSISIPWWFTAGEYQGNVFSDGGLSDNFAISYAQNLTRLAKNPKIIGIHTRSTKRHKSTDLLHFSRNVIRACLENVNRHSHHFRSGGDSDIFIVCITVCDFEVTDFGIDSSQKQDLYDTGSRMAEEARLSAIKEYVESSRASSREKVTLRRRLSF